MPSIRGVVLAIIVPSISALLVQEGDGKPDDVTVPGMGCEVAKCCDYVDADEFQKIFHKTEGTGSAMISRDIADYSPACTVLNLFPKIKQECNAKEVILDCEVCAGDAAQACSESKACGDACVGMNRTCYEKSGTACDADCSALGKAGVSAKGLTLQGALTSNELAVHVLAAGLPLVGTFVEPGTCQDLQAGSAKCWAKTSTHASWTNWKIATFSTYPVTDPPLMWDVSCSKDTTKGLEVWAKWISGSSPQDDKEKDYGGGLPHTFLDADSWNKDPHFPHDGQPRWQCKDIPKHTESWDGAPAPVDYRMVLYSIGDVPCPVTAMPPEKTTTSTTPKPSGGGGGDGGGGGPGGGTIFVVIVLVLVFAAGAAYYFKPELFSQLTGRAQRDEQEMGSVS